MKKIEIEVKLLIRFYDSFFFGGGTGAGKIQSYLLRDIQGFPYISGAALKGCIADYAAALSDLVPAFDNGKTLFGSGGGHQGSLYFENAVLVDKTTYYGMQDSLTELRTGVSISHYTRAKKERQLYTTELSGLGGNMLFKSSVYGFLNVDTYQKDIAYLVAASRLIFALGGKRRSGLGWLKDPLECQVFKGERGVDAASSRQELIHPENVNQWIKEWIGGTGCIR